MSHVQNRRFTTCWPPPAAGTALCRAQTGGLACVPCGSACGQRCPARRLPEHARAARPCAYHGSLATDPPGAAPRRKGAGVMPGTAAHDDLRALWKAEYNRPFVEWDFSYLAGRRTTIRLQETWDFTSSVLAAI